MSFECARQTPARAQVALAWGVIGYLVRPTIGATRKRNRSCLLYCTRQSIIVRLIDINGIAQLRTAAL